jgi:hypothetical protein
VDVRIDDPGHDDQVADVMEGGGRRVEDGGRGVEGGGRDVRVVLADSDDSRAVHMNLRRQDATWKHDARRANYHAVYSAEGPNIDRPLHPKRLRG